MRWCRAAVALLALLLLGSVPGLAQTPVTIIGPVTVGNCVKFFSPVQVQDAGTVCGGAAGSVSSVGNAAADTSLTIAGTGTGPWTGNVTAKLNLANAQTWTGVQTHINSGIKLLGSSTGATTFTSANAGASNFTLTFPAVNDVLAGFALANGGTNNALTASAGGIVWSDASKLNILAGTSTAGQCLLSGNLATPSWGSCGGGGAVSSVSNADGTLTISPTTGAVVASIALGHVNTWTGAQTFSGGITVSSSFTATGLVSLTALAVQAANTVVGNATSLSASPTALAMPSCSTAGSALNWTTNTGFACNTAITAAAVPGTGLTGTTLASNIVTSSLTSVGTLTGGATGAGFTINFAASTESGTLGLANGGTNNALTASAGGIVWSDASKLNILAGTSTAGQCLLSGNLATPSWSACPQTVSSVSNADGTLTISPTTGAVVASIALGHANSWTAAQTFPASGIKLLGSSTGATTLTSANAGASNFTLTLPAVTDTVAVLGTSQTHSATQTFSGTLNVSGTFQIGGTTVALPISLANGGTAAALTASNGGIVYSTASALAVLPGTATAAQCLLSGSNAAPSWGSCSGGAAVSSVSNADGTLTISPTTGAVVASLNLAHANTWSATQTFSAAPNGFTLNGMPGKFIRASTTLAVLSFGSI